VAFRGRCANFIFWHGGRTIVLLVWRVLAAMGCHARLLRCVVRAAGYGRRAVEGDTDLFRRYISDLRGGTRYTSFEIWGRPFEVG
jgi:hypothetical protein